MPNPDPIRALGVSRMADNEKAILVSFDRPPSDDELREFHDGIRRPAQATEGLREALTKAASLLEVMAEAAIVRGDAASWSMASVMAINARAALAPSKIAPSEAGPEWPKQMQSAEERTAFTDELRGLSHTVLANRMEWKASHTPSVIQRLLLIEAANRLAALTSTPAPKIAPMVSVKAFKLSRSITVKECSWLDADIAEGAVVYPYSGETYGCIGPTGIAVSVSPDETPFFELPRAALEPLSQAEGPEPVAWLVRYFDWQRDKVWSE